MLNNTKKLKKYMNKANIYAERIWDPEYRIYMIINNSNIKNIEGDANSLLKYLLENEHYLTKNASQYHLEWFYDLMYATYKNIWNFEEALKYRNKSFSLREKRINLDSKKNKADMEAKYESDKKDQEIKTQQLELKEKENEAEIAEWKAKRNKIMKYTLYTR